LYKEGGWLGVQGEGRGGEVDLVAIAIVCSSYINVLYSYINLSILDLLHSVEIAFFIFFFSSYVCICALVFLLTFLAEKYLFEHL